MAFRVYTWNGYLVTAAEFGERVSNLMAQGWILTPPATEETPT